MKLASLNAHLRRASFAGSSANFSRQCVRNFMEGRSKFLGLRNWPPDKQIMGMAKKPRLAPIAAYDAFAPYYSAYASTRASYLQKIEDLVIAHAPAGASLLDVGAGDGNRALRIAHA